MPPAPAPSRGSEERPRPILLSAAWRASKNAWCGAGWMESIACKCIRPVTGENVYVEFLHIARGVSAGNETEDQGQDVHFPTGFGLADTVGAADGEVDEEALLADAARLRGRLGAWLVGTQAGGGGGARAVHPDALELDAQVGVERVQGVAEEDGRCEVDGEACMHV